MKHFSILTLLVSFFISSHLAHAGEGPEVAVSFKSTIAFQNYFFNLEFPESIEPQKLGKPELNAKIQKLVLRAMETQNFKEIVQQCQAKFFNATAVVTSIKFVYPTTGQVNVSCVRYESWEALGVK